MNKLGICLLTLSIAVAPFHSWAQEDNLDPHPQAPKTKPYSWKANVFAGSALLAAAAGIVVICLNGGTSNGATQRLKAQDAHDHPNHHRQRHHHHDYDQTNLKGIYE